MNQLSTAADVEHLRNHVREFDLQRLHKPCLSLSEYCKNNNISYYHIRPYATKDLAQRKVIEIKTRLLVNHLKWAARQKYLLTVE